MKRSLRETIELLVFALIALLIGIGLLWLFGFVLGIVGFVFKAIAGFIWMLLKYIIPLAIIAAAVYALIKLIQRDRDRDRQQTQAVTPATEPAYAPPPPPVATAPVEPAKPTAPEPATGETDENAREDGEEGNKEP